MLSPHLKKNLLICLVYTLTSIVLEITLFCFLGFGFLPKYFLFDFGVLMIINSVIFLLPGYKSKSAIAISFIVLQAILNCLNITLFNIFGDVFSFDMIALGNEAAAAFSLSYIKVVPTLVNLLIVAVAIASFVFILKTGKKRGFYSTTVAIFLAFTIICSFGLGAGLIKIQKSYLENATADYTSEYFESDDYLFENLNVKISALKKFGTYGLYFTDIYNSLGIESAKKSIAEQQETMAYISNAKTVSELNAQTEYTGLSANNNVITVMVESLEWFAIDDQLTPNLYALTQNALNFQSFYARNKTNVSEGVGILGSYPKSTQFSTFYRSNSAVEAKSLPFSLPNMIKANNSNYVTNYFHNYYGYFYGRDSILPTFGFDTVTCLENIDEYLDNPPAKFNDFMCDSIMIDACINEIAPTNKPFYSHITTVSMHGEYDFERPRIAEFVAEVNNNLDYLRDYLPNNSNGVYNLPTNTHDLNLFKNYKAAAMETDKAIGKLFKHLQDNNLLDNTTVVIYADHNTYLSQLTNKMKGFSDTELFNTELYRIPLLIYDEKATTKFKAENGGSNIVDDFCTTFNIVPTVMDLLGIDYKPDFYQGTSVFTDDNKTGFISIIGGIFDDKFFSYDTIDILFQKPTATNNDLKLYQQKSVDFYAKQIHLERIYKYNLFAKFKI